MKPSRVASNGLLTIEVDKAVIFSKPATAVIVAADSDPPEMTASHIPHEICRAA
ncbi:unannotated protein [freshwater metagenome]|uniref:Unannotated protein n=1 Tax=freshwater metagenome TaxID=449393 RepID=A0A6J6HLJ5_9ZZZZ